ncbi:kinase-like protein [Marasmius fiardii PR-910]|nr:kinase-like protein [Marasmius fiardii PR-910]
MNLVKLPLRKSENLDDVLRIVEGVLRDQQQSRKLLETTGEDAQIWLDTLQVLTELPGTAGKLRSSILKMTLHLSKRSGLCPQCLMVKNVKRLGDFPVGGGGFGDVWKGKIGEQIVCLKVVKVYLVSDVQKLLKEYMREAIVWQQLKHPNVLPFMGIYYLDKAREQLCLVSPWMERGNLTRFLKEAPSENVDHYSLAYDVAFGLAYLHSRKIVHGDMKGVNILITPDGRACIGDFGLSRVADTQAIRLTSSTTVHARGTTRWLAPELLRTDPPCIASMSSDIYAYACVCYEIFTGNIPFHELTDGAVIVAVLLDKKHPPRPHPDLTPLTDDMWSIMVSCWNLEAHLRPEALELFTNFLRPDGLKSLKTHHTIHPAPEWDTFSLAQLWKNVKLPQIDTATLVRLQEKLDPSAAAPSASTPVPQASEPALASQIKVRSRRRPAGMSCL